MTQRRSSRPDQTGSWRPGDAQLRWIIENRLDEAYLLSWPGELETYIPVHDTGGYDRARAPLGSYDWRLDQVEGTSNLHGDNEVRIAFDTPALHPRRHLDFTFVRYDLGRRALEDPAWLVPSLKLDEACVPDKMDAGRLHHHLERWPCEPLDPLPRPHRPGRIALPPPAIRHRPPPRRLTLT